MFCLDFPSGVPGAPLDEWHVWRPDRIEPIPRVEYYPVYLRSLRNLGHAKVFGVWRLLVNAESQHIIVKVSGTSLVFYRLCCVMSCFSIRIHPNLESSLYLVDAGGKMWM
jgi:hypothetical protein